MLQFSLWDILSKLLIATQWTIVLSLIAFFCGGIVGLILLFMRTSKIPALEWSTKIYIELFQGTPLLMQLFLFFFGIALFGVEVSPWMAATMALTFWTSAFLAEIWRGCVESIPKGQWEASSSLAMTKWEVLRHIILKQAFQKIYPALSSQIIIVMLGSAVVSQISAQDLTYAANLIASRNFRNFEVYLLVALAYLLLAMLTRSLLRGLGRYLFKAK